MVVVIVVFEGKVHTIFHGPSAADDAQALQLELGPYASYHTVTL